MRAVRLVLPLAFLAVQVAGDLDIRVAKGVKERGYDSVRVSMVDHGQGSGDLFFDYHGKFFGAWEKFHLHTAVKQVKGNATFSIGGQDVRIRVPVEGERARGLIFSDPCISSAGGMGCQWQELFKTEERLAKVVSQFVGSDDIDFWGILGDNFYESNMAGGDITKGFFDALSMKAKAKPLLSVPGNHDFWIAGGPPGLPEVDQFAYGFLQMYGQDTLAGLQVHDNVPYDFSIPAAKGQIPVQENFVFSHQIGDLAFFGYSGAHPQEDLHPHLLNFCAWLAETPSVNSAVILGHWNVDNLGCQQGMATPEVYEAARALPGCKEKDLVFVDGHDHCNRVHVRYPNHGFLIGGNGMGGDCPRQQFGFLVLESDPGSGLRVDYFELASLVTQDMPLHNTEQLNTLKAALEGESNFLPQGARLGKLFIPPGVIDTFSVGLPSGRLEAPKPMLRKADLPEKIAKGGVLTLHVQEISSIWDAFQICVKANPQRPYTACRAQYSQTWRAGRPKPPPPPPHTPPPPPQTSPPPPPNATEHPPLPETSRTTVWTSRPPRHSRKEVQHTSSTTHQTTTTTSTVTQGRQSFHLPDHSVDVVLPQLDPGLGRRPLDEVEIVLDQGKRGPEVFHQRSRVSLAGHEAFHDAGSVKPSMVQPDYRTSHQVGDQFPMITLIVTGMGVGLMVVGGCLAACTAGGTSSAETDRLLEEDARHTTC